ncbi:MAG: hypothetical protein FWF38_00245 [Spirochaetaceae bacterium]|nr:hypothetical protein [Spirochaetaceae bacterium]
MRGYKKIVTVVVLLIYVSSMLPFPIYSEEYPLLVLESEEVEIKAGEGGIIKLEGVSIEIPAGSLDKDTLITIKRLIKTHDTGEELKNATAGGGGYKFLPAGTKFKKEAVIRMSYDPALPEDQVNNLRTYFYDKKESRWKSLEIIDIDRSSHEVVSVTNHFTDMINATLTLPESASPLRFNINSIKNLEAANPGNAIGKIEGLEGVSTGSASFRIALNIPGGRRGMSPQVAISYTSDGGVGIMGKGFDLSAGGSISTDTRWGLPKYDGADDYLLDGVKLRLARSVGGVDEYGSEREAEYEKIERLRSSGDYWVVTGKNGTKRLYGASDSLNSWAGSGAGKKYIWYLEREEDIYANSVVYKYERDSGYVYLKEISYTGKENEEGSYRIIFNYASERIDERIDGRGGYLSVQKKLLKEIRVQYKEYLLRSYELEYEEDIFHRVNQLVKYREVSGDGRAKFYEYSFDYERILPNAKGEYEIYGAQEEWSLDKGLHVQQSVNSGFDGSGSIGAGIGTKKYDLRVGGGGRASSNSGESQTIHTLVDINGDGLPDSVVKKSGGLEIRLNDGNNKFGNPTEVRINFPGINAEETKSTSTGWNIYGGLGSPPGSVKAGVSYASTNQKGSAESSTAFVDVDGDGLIDIVISGEDYYYKNISDGKEIKFKEEKWFNVGYGVVSDAVEQLTDEEKKEYDKRFYQQSLLRGWKAVKPGLLEIGQSVRAVAPSNLSGDGIAAKSYKGNEAPFSVMEINRSESSKTSLGKELAIGEGEYLYFLSNAGKDTVGDDVIWNIKIRYKEIMPYFDMQKGIVYKPKEEIFSNGELADKNLETIYNRTLYDDGGDGGGYVTWYQYTLKLNWESAAGGNYDYIIGYLKENGLFIPGRIKGEDFKGIERVLGTVTDIGELNSYYDALLKYYIYDVNSDEYLLNNRNKESFNSSSSGVREWKEIEDKIAQAIGKCSAEERDKLLSYKWDDGKYYEIKKESGKSYIEIKGLPLAIETDGPGNKKNGKMVLDNIEGKELSISPDYKTVYIDEAVYSAEGTGAAGTKDNKALLVITVPIRHKDTILYKQVYNFSGYEGISNIVEEEDLKKVQEKVQTLNYTLANYSVITVQRMIGIEDSLSEDDYQLFLGYYEEPVAGVEADYIIIEDLTALEKLELEKILEKLAWFDFLRELFPYYEKKEDGKYYLKTKYQGLLSLSAGMSVSLISSKINELIVQINNLTAEISALPDGLEKEELETKKILLEEDKLKWENVKELVSAGMEMGKDRWLSVGKNIIYYHDGLYSLENNGSVGNIKQLYLENNNFIYKEKEIRNWDSGKDYSVADLVRSPLSYEYEEFFYDEEGVKTGEKELVRVEMEVEELLYGGINNWYYGLWLGNQEGENSFSQSLLRKQKEDALTRYSSEDQMEQKSESVKNNPEGFEEEARQSVYMKVSANVYGQIDYGYDAEGLEDIILDISEGDKQIEVDEDTRNVMDGEYKKSEALEKDFLIGTVSTVVKSSLEYTGDELVTMTRELTYAPYIKGDFIHTSRFGGSSYYEIDGIKGSQSGGSSSYGSSMTMVKIRKSNNENKETTKGANISLPARNVSNIIEGFRHITTTSVGASGSYSDNNGSSRMIQSYQDVNGDGIPDIIQKNGNNITVTPGNASGFGNPYTIKGVSGDLSRNINNATGYGGSVNGGTSIYMEYSSGGWVKTANVSGSSSNSYNYTSGTSDQMAGFIDINGDGLPDYVDGGTLIFNTGENFLTSSHASYSLSGIYKTENTSLGLSIPLSGKSGESVGQGNNTEINYAVGGGLSYSVSMNSTKEKLIDINGDGLPDKVIKSGEHFIVFLNLGSCFSDTPIMIEAKNWNLSGDKTELVTKTDGNLLVSAVSKLPIVGKVANGTGLLDNITGGIQVNPLALDDKYFNVIEGSSSVSTGINGTLKLDLNISIRIPVPILKLYLNLTAFSGGAGINGGASINSVSVEMRDIDGDGLADRVIRIPATGRIYVQRNLAGKAGLLNKVTLPQGGEYNLYYQREGNTCHMSQSKYVLSKVVMDDGCLKEGRIKLSHGENHVYIVEYEYHDGYYDRGEKEFYGFSKVITKYPDGQKKETFYAMPLDKGLNRDKVSASYYKKGMVEEEIVYSAEGKVFKQTIYSLDNSPHRRVIREESSQYDLLNTNEKLFNRVEYTYGSFGNIIHINNEWKESAGRDKRLYANIEYNFNNSTRYLHSHPTKIEVYDKDHNLLRKRTGAYNSSTGSLMALTQYDGDKESLSELTWDSYGNLKSIKDSGGATIIYEYDSLLTQYVTEIKVKGFATEEYSSYMDWDIRYGRKIGEKEESGNQIRYEYDDFGRLYKIYSPYDNYPGGVPSVKYNYNMEEGKPWYAVTENKVLFDESNKDVIKSVVITDYMGRLYLTAKRGVKREENGFDKEGFNISGVVAYDHKWRIIEEGQNQFVEGDISELLTKAPSISLVRSTKKEYDSLDRLIKITLPDNAEQNIKYGIEGNISYIETKDPLGNITREEKDSKGNITGILKYEKDKNKILTSVEYAYDEMGQMLQAKDHRGNPIKISYDLLGRKKSLESPDIGRKEYKYDTRGNLIEESDSVLRSKGYVIKYEYDGLNRLTKIIYPQSKTVTYEYGKNSHSAINGVNRVIKLTDESGYTTYEYGKLGEVIREARRIDLLSPGRDLAPQVMEYRSDYLGRMQEITYPDGETVSYIYDVGGQIKSVKGVKFSNREVYYIKDIAYDEYGNRKFIEYGNGVKTYYNYDENRRWLENIKTQSDMELQNINYSFDLVGNVSGCDNSARRYETNHTYEYDNLYQLIAAQGTHKSKPHDNLSMYQISNYSQKFTFDAIGNMTRKESKTNINYGSPLGDNLNYNNDYVYYEEYGHRIKQCGNRYYQYDLNGNITLEREGGLPSVNDRDISYYELRENLYYAEYGFAIGDAEGKPSSGSAPYERRFKWNEKNQMISSEDQRISVRYAYGHDGERANKQTMAGGESVYYNSMWNIRYIPAYGNSYRESKHIYVGQSRLVTKNSDIGSKATNNPTNDGISTYYYHSDHLGSAQLITDYKGNEYERLEYTPYGELWINHKKEGAIDAMPYRFTGKELDEETGFYYYGARYLDPMTSRWLSTDPAMPDYMPQAPGNEDARKNNQNLPGLGGIYNIINMHIYHYAGNNPMRYVDPDGMRIMDYDDNYLMQDASWSSNEIGKGKDLMENAGCAVVMLAKAFNTLYRNFNPDSINKTKDYFSGSNIDMSKPASEWSLDYKVFAKDIKEKLEQLKASETEYAIGAQVKYNANGNLHFVNVEDIVTLNGESYIQISPTSKWDKEKTIRPRETWEMRDGKMYVNLKDVENIRVFSYKNMENDKK